MKSNLWITALVCCLASCGPKVDEAAQLQEELNLQKARLEAAKMESERIALEAANKAAASKLKPSATKETPKAEEKEVAAAEPTEADKEKKAAEAKAEAERLAAKAKELEKKAAAAKAARARVIGTEIPTLMLANGETFKMVRVRDITDTSVSVSHDSGMATFKMPELTTLDKTRFHYDADLYQAAIDKVEAAKAAAEAKAAAAAAAAAAPASEAPPVAAHTPAAADAPAVDPAEAARIKMIHSRIAEEERILADMKVNHSWLNSQRSDLITKNLTATTPDLNHEMNLRGYDARIAAADKLIKDAEGRIAKMRAAAPPMPAAPTPAPTPGPAQTQVAQGQPNPSPAAAPPVPAPPPQKSAEELRQEAARKALDAERKRYTLLRSQLVKLTSDRSALQKQYTTEKVRTASSWQREKNLQDFEDKITETNSAIRESNRRMIELKTQL